MADSEERTAPLDLVVDLAAHHVVITVRGEIDYLTADQLRRCLEHSAAAIGPRVLVLDLSAVTYFGSVGLAILLEAAEDLTQRSSATHPLRVVVDESRPVIRPIQIGGVQSAIRLHHEVDDALRDHQPPDLRRRGRSAGSTADRREAGRVPGRDGERAAGTTRVQSAPSDNDERRTTMPMFPRPAHLPGVQRQVDAPAAALHRRARPVPVGDGLSRGRYVDPVNSAPTGELRTVDHAQLAGRCAADEGPARPGGSGST